MVQEILLELLHQAQQLIMQAVQEDQVVVVDIQVVLQEQVIHLPQVLFKALMELYLNQYPMIEVEAEVVPVLLVQLETQIKVVVVLL